MNFFVDIKFYFFEIYIYTYFFFNYYLSKKLGAGEFSLRRI